MKKFSQLFFIFSVLINAQVSWDPLYNLSNTPSATSDYHAVHSDEFGNYYVVWGDNGNILFKRSSDFGYTWSANITVFASSNVCGWPVVKSDDNHVYVVFHQLAGDYEIIFLHSSDYGQTWDPPQFLSGMDDGSITPQLAVSGSNVFAVWERRVNNYYDIIFRKSTDRGTIWSTEENISNSLGSHSRWVQLEAVDNILYCAWLESTTYPASDIYFSKSTDGGDTWWLTPPNITNNTRPQNRIYMKASGDDIYIVSDDIITFNFDELYLMKSSDGGGTWSTPANITNNAGHSNTPCIEIHADNIYLTWADNSHTAPAYDNMDIFFKWSSDGGVTWRDSINLSDNFETSSRPRICSMLFVTLQGVIWAEFTVVWYDYSTGDAEILARKGTHFIIPVELTSFTSEVKGNDVLLNWTTASEINNKGFEIERLQDYLNGSHRDKIPGLKDWEVIGFIEGKGTTTEVQSYSFTDKGLSNGKYLYRLKQIDFDGSFEYSQIINAEINFPAEFSLEQNYPNPFNPSTKIKFTIPDVISTPIYQRRNLWVTLKVYDLLGNEVSSLVNEELSPGIYTIDWNAGSLANGIYFYTLYTNDFIQTRKMILLK